MRVGLCVSGHFRNYRESLPSWEPHLLGPLRAAGWEVAVFVSTWSVLGGTPQNDGGLVQTALAPHWDAITAYLGGVTRARIEAPRVFDGSPYPDHRCHFDPAHAVSMFYKIHDSYQVYQEWVSATGVTCDRLIRIRPDLCFETPFPVTSLERAGLGVPDFAHWGGLNDQLAWGTPEALAAYTSTYLHLADFYRAGHPFHPETYTQLAVQQAQLLPRSSPVRYTLVRADGSQLRQW